MEVRFGSGEVVSDSGEEVGGQIIEPEGRGRCVSRRERHRGWWQSVSAR